ncbi:hypothetical protein METBISCDRAFT_23005 [Metschnikowia bicuspidata]|uniref:Uncharacterized protein n=1 Tax=Metschnikowia bicuspidata TaxID=27322 RepID=A0A4P9ZF03_9ASCO|nr:hypothetical protein METBISCDRAFT_23005 [Metschnikowia bicuspidata]
MDLSNAFNNYCITCDKLVCQNFVYCLTQCRDKDEFLTAGLQACTGDNVSPLLTPSLYHQSNASEGVIGLPLLLFKSIPDDDVRDFSLNYLVSQTAPSLVDSQLATPLNYRLWLTRVL